MMRTYPIMSQIEDLYFPQVVNKLKAVSISHFHLPLHHGKRTKTSRLASHFISILIAYAYKDLANLTSLCIHLSVTSYASTHISATSYAIVHISVTSYSSAHVFVRAAMRYINQSTCSCL